MNRKYNQVQHLQTQLTSLKARLSHASGVNDYQAILDELKIFEGPLSAENSDQVREEQVHNARAETSTTSGWGEILDLLGSSRELERPLELLKQELNGGAKVQGVTPVEGWIRCYSYFEAVSEHLKTLEAMSQRVEEDPSYLQLALETLKLRALSQQIHSNDTP